MSDNEILQIKYMHAFHFQLCPKFRVVGAIALTLIRLKSAIIANSYERTKRSAVEMQWLTLCSQQHESETMVFSKSYFSREKVVK